MRWTRTLCRPPWAALHGALEQLAPGMDVWIPWNVRLYQLSGLVPTKTTAAVKLSPCGPSKSVQNGTLFRKPKPPGGDLDGVQCGAARY